MIEIAFPVRERGALKVSGFSRPSDEVAVRVYAPVLLPTRMLPYVGAEERPVPPYTTESVLVADTTPLIAWRLPLSAPMVKVPLKVLEPEYVLLVVVLKAVVNAPVAELYASGYEALTDEDLILLLKVVKSAEERYPFCAAVATWIARVEPLNESGEETVVACTAPLAAVERSEPGTREMVRFEVDAVVNDCVPAQVLLVVVPKARERTFEVLRSGYVVENAVARPREDGRYYKLSPEGSR